MLFTRSDVAVEVWEGKWKKWKKSYTHTVMCTAIDIAAYGLQYCPFYG